MDLICNGAVSISVLMQVLGVPFLPCMVDNISYPTMEHYLSIAYSIWLATLDLYELYDCYIGTINHETWN